MSAVATGVVALLLAGPSAEVSQPQPQPQPAPAPAPVILDRDGKPLPIDVQRDLKRPFADARPEPPPAATPPPPAPGPPDASPGEVVVRAQRARGSVIGNLPPERSLSALDIAGYGASDIGELVRTLAPQIGEGADRTPITLLNGRRVASFGEIANIPAEAIERVDVFPAELAVKYGYRPTQKVVNIVTLERFRSRIGQLGGTAATEGGYALGRVQVNHLALRGETRIDIGAGYNRADALLESDRDIVQPGAAGAARFRTLIPATETVNLTALVSGPVRPDISATLSGRWETNDSESRFGTGASGPLVQDSRTRTANLGTTLNGLAGKWQWSFTGKYDRLSTDVRTATGDAALPWDRARSVSTLLNADLLANGSFGKLPAGPVGASVRIGADARDLASRSRRGGIVQDVDLARDRAAIQGSVNVPIVRRGTPSSWPGDLSANLNLGAERLSDLGTLRSVGYGFDWSVAPVSVVASVTSDERAPTIEQLGAPAIATPNVRTLDFRRGETVDLTRVFGGNPALRSEDRRVFRLGLTARPLATADLTLSAEYQDIRIDDPVVAFPLATARIEAAFPDRFQRGADGRLLRIDSRPLNFARSEQTQVRLGFSFTRPLGRVEPWMRSAPVRTYASEADARAAVRPGTSIAMVQPGSAMAQQFENLSSRLYVNVFYTRRWRDTVVPRDGIPALDLLDGAALDTLADSRRHRLEAQAGVFQRGLGARVGVNWRSGTAIRDAAFPAGDLSFADLATVDLNLFANLADRFGGADAPAWLKGFRLTMGVTNVFNARQQVRDATGRVPLNYQPGYLDPLGRSISIGLRKVF